jgi:S1-C subfamily serine protease
MRQVAWVIMPALAAVIVGTASAQERPFKLGIVPDYADTSNGVLVQEVVADSPAAKAGLKVGDRITGLAGNPVKGIPDYVAAIKGLKKGDAVEVRFARDGKESMVKANLE